MFISVILIVYKNVIVTGSIAYNFNLVSGYAFHCVLQEFWFAVFVLCYDISQW